MGRQPRNQTEKNWLMDWQSTQKIKDPKSVIFDQVAVVKPILGKTAIYRITKGGSLSCLKTSKMQFLGF